MPGDDNRLPESVRALGQQGRVVKGFVAAPDLAVVIEAHKMVLFGQPEPVGGQIVPLLLCQWPRERLHLLQNPGGTGAHGLLIAVIGLGRDDLADPQRRPAPGVADGAQQDLLIRIGAAPDHGDLVGPRRLRQIPQAHMVGEVRRPLVAMGGLAHMVPPGCARGHA